jgi:hypothetical protein
MSSRLFFAYFGVIRGIYLLTENLIWFGTFTLLVGAVFNFFLNIILINLYGSIGAVISSIVSFATTILFLDVIYRRTRYNVKIMFQGIITFFKFESLKSKN